MTTKTAKKFIRELIQRYRGGDPELQASTVKGLYPTNTPGKVYFGSAYLSDGSMYKTFYDLKKKGVTIIWNLQEEAWNIQEETSEFYVVHTPIRDYSIPYSKEMFIQDLSEICGHLIRGNSIFIHCWGGHGRTGLALASLSVWCEGMDPQEALQKSKKYCNGPEVKLQREFVRYLRSPGGPEEIEKPESFDDDKEEDYVGILEHYIDNIDPQDND